MPTLSQPSFAGGEIAPGLYGRSDLARYQTGLRHCENWVIRRQGGVSNRAGFQFIAEVINSALTVRLVPFEFSEDQTYVLEFSDTYVRFIRDGGLVQKASASAWNIAVAYSTAAFVEYSGIIYRAIVSSTGQQPDVSPAYWVANTEYRVATPYTEAELMALQFIQSADVLTIVHENHPPAELRRMADDNWIYSAVDFTPNLTAPTNLQVTPFDASTPQKLWTWVVTAVDANGQESLPSAPDGPAFGLNLQADKPAHLDWDAVTGAVSYNVYRARNGMYGYIGNADSNDFDDDNIVPAYADAPPTWANPFASSYPGVVAYFQQRLMFARTAAKPETIWGSRSGDYHNFGAASPPKDDDALEFTMVGRQVNEVRHLVPLDQLLVLTKGGEWRVTGGEDGVLTPSNILPRGQSSFGSSTVPPLLVGESVLYLQQKGSVVRDLRFSFADDGFVSDDLTILATHLFEGHTVIDWAYSQVPFSIVWAVRDDGMLLGFTYMREQEVWAWHRHTTPGLFERVCVVSEGEEDALYAVVRRIIGGVAKRYIERLHVREDGDITAAFFVDSGLSYDGYALQAVALTVLDTEDVEAGDPIHLSGTAVFTGKAPGDIITLRNSGDRLRLVLATIADIHTATATCIKTVPGNPSGASTLAWVHGDGVTSITGLDHLEGREVAILADGSVLPVQTVVAGAVILPQPAIVVHAGLPYTADLETLDLAVSGEVVRDKQKIIPRVNLQVAETRGLWAGQSREMLEEIQQRSDEAYGDPIQPYTGLLEVRTDASWNKRGRVVVQQPNPLPATILALLPEVQIGGA